MQISHLFTAVAALTLPLVAHATTFADIANSIRQSHQSDSLAPRQQRVSTCFDACITKFTKESECYDELLKWTHLSGEKWNKHVDDFGRCNCRDQAAMTFLSTCIPKECGRDAEWDASIEECKGYGITVQEDGTIGAAGRIEIGSMGGLAALAGMAVMINGV